MGAITTNESSIESDIYIQRLSAYIKRNEEGLAHGLLCFSKTKHNLKSKPFRISFSLHHLYCIAERLESSPLGVDVGPLNIKLDSPNHEPTFISFMANNARSSKHFESDAKSISSINSMKSIVSSASVYWRNFAFSKDPKVVNKDLRYLYSSFTKLPCLILTPKTNTSSISGYEEYPCDTSVPMRMFKNLQVLELVDYEPIEIFGWNTLSEQLRILIIRNSKVNDIAEILFTLVIDDETGRSSFNNHKQSKKSDWFSDYYGYGTGYGNGYGHGQHHSHTSHHDLFNDYSFGGTGTNGGISGSGVSVSGGSIGATSSAGGLYASALNTHNNNINNNSAFINKRERATTTGGAGSVPKEILNDLAMSKNRSATSEKNYQHLADTKWSFLKQLTVSETSITSIPSYVFKPLNNLVKLNLSGNLLENLPDGLDQLTNIKYLNFSDNYITSLKNLPRNLKNLSTLNFNNNKLNEIDGIENLIMLEKIDLRRNDLKSISLLKPLVLQFIKNPEKLNNIYLSGNGLPKNYRTDLFNLFNGVKYKNNVKLDDSRPGYFESALLLDAEAAFKFLEKFFDLDRRHSIAAPQPPRRTSVSTSKISNGHVAATATTTKNNTGINRNSTIDNPDSHGALANDSRFVSNAKSHLEAINKNQAINKNHRRAAKSTSDINELLDPFSSFNLNQSKKESRRSTNVITTTTTLTTPKVNYSPTTTIKTLNSPAALSDVNSIISSASTVHKPASPLGNNQNLSNQFHKSPASPYDNVSLSDLTYTSRPMKPSVGMNSPSMNSSPSQTRSSKRSSTMTQLDIEATYVNGPAPNVITPVQVQVEGFQ